MAIVAVLLIIAIVGGAVGGTLGRKKASTSGDSTPGDRIPGDRISNSSLLENSALASFNWTDSSNFLHRGILYQNKTNTILCSV